MLIGERVDTRINLGVRACERLAHDWDNLLLASCRVRDDLLFERGLGSSAGRCRGDLLRAQLAEVLVLVLHSLVLNILI